MFRLRHNILHCDYTGPVCASLRRASREAEENNRNPSYKNPKNNQKSSYKNQGKKAEDGGQNKEERTSNFER